MNWFKWYVRIVNRLGFEKEPKEFILSNTYADNTELLVTRLRERSYYYNAVSTTYKGQVFTVRKLVGLDHQIHLRFYKNGSVTGHFEMRPEHPIEHLMGFDLRRLDPIETEEIRGIVYG